MIQTLEKSYAEIRTVFDTESCKVSVCRSLSKQDHSLYTLVQPKSRDLQTRLLQIFSASTAAVPVNGFAGLITVESSIAAVFRYEKESPLFYYHNLYCKNFADQLQVARDLVAEMITNSLPAEVRYLMMEDCNINLTADKQVHFNYFINLSLLPDMVTEQDIISRTAETAFRILSAGMKTFSGEMELFRLKTERKAFYSFADLYAHLKRISPDRLTDMSVFARAKRLYEREKGRLAFAAKAVVFLAIVGVTLFYSVTEWQNRAIYASAQNGSSSKYTGLNQIGTVVLSPEKSSDPSSTSVEK